MKTKKVNKYTRMFLSHLHIADRHNIYLIRLNVWRSSYIWETPLQIKILRWEINALLFNLEMPATVLSSVICLLVCCLLTWILIYIYIYIYIYIHTHIGCDFDRASSLICGNKKPTRCNRGFYCRYYCLLNIFRAPLCPTSGAQEYYTVVAACGISCCGFQVAGLVWS